MTEKPWKPDVASKATEAATGGLELPAADREVVRRFAEFLRRRQAKAGVQTLPPMPEGVKQWLLGEL